MTSGRATNSSIGSQTPLGMRNLPRQNRQVEVSEGSQFSFSGIKLENLILASPQSTGSNGHRGYVYSTGTGDYNLSKAKNEKQNQTKHWQTTCNHLRTCLQR